MYSCICFTLQRATLTGELKPLEAQAARLKSDLDKDYKDIERKHTDLYQTVELEMMTEADLEKAMKAIETYTYRFLLVLNSSVRLSSITQAKWSR